MKYVWLKSKGGYLLRQSGRVMKKKVAYDWYPIRAGCDKVGWYGFCSLHKDVIIGFPAEMIGQRVRFKIEVIENVNKC